MWLYKIGAPDTPSLILAQFIWYLPFFAFPTFWNSVTDNSPDFSNNNVEQASFFLFIYMLLLAISLYVVLPAIKSDYNYIIEYIFIWGGGITSYRISDKLKV